MGIIGMDEEKMFALAAKAAEINIWRWKPAHRAYEMHGGGDYFDPLMSADQAFNLQLVLNMTISHEPSRGGWSAGAVVNGEFKWLSHSECLKYAIVQAAAEIGMAMP